MACNHKFLNDIQLEYVDWEPTTLFIGTFNPEWGECLNNNAQWFYGRTSRNDFWCILPTIFNSESLINGNRDVWIKFCKKNKIAITDIIKSIDNADVNNINHRNVICKFKDNDIENFQITLNNIPLILDNFPSIRQICITRQTLKKFWSDCFDEVFQYEQLNPNREIEIIKLRSPSRFSRKGVVGAFCEFIANRWTEQGFLTNS